jgi:tape measure domain-containing protein
MAGSIKGIIVEIGGDTSGLQKALKQVNTTTSNLSKELKGINSLLKLDPKNTELLAQKQAVLSQNIQETTNKLNQLKQAQKLADDTIKNGGTISQENYRNLQREIINTENKLKQLKVEASNWTKVSKSLDNISSKMKSVGNVVTSVGQKFLGLTATLGAGIAYGVKYNAEMENLATNLKVLLGSQDKANKMLKDLKEMAATTPYETNDLVSATKTLLSFGVSADKVQGILKTLGDVAMGNKDSLSSLALVFGQISANGKLTGQDLLQLVNVGFNPLQIISEKTGKSMEILRKEMSEGKITINDVEKAFKVATSEGGLFYKGMEEGSKTLSGKFSTSMDAMKEAIGGLTKSLLPILTKFLDKVTEWINKFNSLDQGTKNIILVITGLITIIGPLLIIIGKIISAGGVIFGLLSKVSGAIAGVSAGTGTLSTVLTTLTGPIGVVIGVITALGTAFVYLFNTNEEFRNKAMEVWNSLVNLFNETIIPAFNTIKAAVMSALNTVWKLWQQLWEKLEPFVTKILTWLMNFWNNTLKGIIENVVNFITKLIQGWTELYNNVIAPIISALVDVLWPVVERVLNAIWSTISGVFDAIGGVIKAITGILDGLITFITGVFTGDWEKAWQGISDIFKNIVEGLWSIIKTPLNWIIDGINGLISGINGIKIPDWVPGVGGKSLSIPKIPRLAKGGIVDQATLAMVGEGKSAEAIIPLDRTLTRYMSEALKDAGANNNITVNFYPQQMTEAELDNAFNYINRRFGLQY